MSKKRRDFLKLSSAAIIGASIAGCTETDGRNVDNADTTDATNENSTDANAANSTTNSTTNNSTADNIQYEVENFTQKAKGCGRRTEGTYTYEIDDDMIFFSGSYIANSDCEKLTYGTRLRRDGSTVVILDLASEPTTDDSCISCDYEISYSGMITITSGSVDELSIRHN